KGFLDIPDINYVIKDVYLYEESLNLKMRCKNEFSKGDKGYYFSSSCDWELFDIEKYGEVNLKFMIHVESNGHDIEFSLASNLDDINDKSKAIIYPPLNQNINGYPMQIQPYYTQQNELSVFVQNSLKAYCISMNSNKNHMTFVVSSIIEGNLEARDAKLIFKERKSGHTIKHNGELNKHNEYQFSIDKSLMKVNEIHEVGKWDVYFSAKVNNNHVEAKVFCDDENIIKQNSTFKSNAIKFENSLYGSLFFDKRNKMMSFETRDLKAHEKKYEKVRFLMATGVAK
ncbi:hypothetical protein P7M56_28615, partial [Vibrio parahaemolyticus]|nr:hypothetical protein [Vibrio parahaemolyticus]